MGGRGEDAGKASPGCRFVTLQRVKRSPPPIDWPVLFYYPPPPLAIAAFIRPATAANTLNLSVGGGGQRRATHQGRGEALQELRPSGIYDPSGSSQPHEGRSTPALQTGGSEEASWRSHFAHF